MTTPLPRLLLIAATEAELAPIRNALEVSLSASRSAPKVQFDYLVTGVGPIQTALVLTEYLLATPAHLLIDVGIAGCFRQNQLLGTVVNVVRDTFADHGAEAPDGRLISVFELGFAEADQSPYQQGYLLGLPHASSIDKLTPVLREMVGRAQRLPAATGVTLGRAHGAASSIAAFRAAYPAADCESMEGAAVFAVAFRQNLPAIQLRAYSNYVEPRNRASWQIHVALANLAAAVVEMITATAATGDVEAVGQPPPSR